MLFYLCLIITTFTSVYFAIILHCRLTCGMNKRSRHLVGKVVIVTGGNNGIGYETAKDLADRGAKVIIASRNEERGKIAVEKIVAHTDNNNVHFKKLDLASFKSVREFAIDIIKNEIRLDILINNAGIYGGGTVAQKTEDGYLLDFQTNHLGHFLLTSLLLPLLKTSAPSRIINVSSGAYALGEIDFDNLNAEKEYKPNAAYKTNKLCNVLMAVEMAKRLQGTGVTINSLHPGAVDTDILKDVEWLKWILPLFRFASKTPWEGAQTTIYLAVSPEVKGVSGKYFADCKEKAISKHGRDDYVARKLWNVSEKLVKAKVN